MRPVFSALLAIALGAAGARAQLPEVAPPSLERTQGPLTYRFQLRQPVEGSDKVGVDFNVQYIRDTNDADPSGANYRLVANAVGFQDFDGSVRSLDNMTGEVKVEGDYYYAGLSAEEGADLARILAKNAAEWTPEESARLRDLMAKWRRSRRYLTFDGHYRFETTQDVAAKQHVLGIGAAAELPHLHRVLDLFAQVLGADSTPSQPVRAYLGGDYVTGLSGIRTDSGAVADAYPRIRFEAAWGARILTHLAASSEELRGLRLRANWQVHYLPDAPAALEGVDRTLSSFFESWIEYPITESAGLLVKYADGHLPPTYQNTSTVRLGFSISFR